MKIALVMVLLATSWSCGRYDCTLDSPSLDVAVRLGALETAPASLEMLAEIGGDRYSTRFDVSQALSDGETSLRIQLGPQGGQPVDVLLTARAFSEADGRGQMLAETTHLVAASPDGCNQVLIDLWPRRLVCESSCTADCKNADLCPVQCATGSRCDVDCRQAGECAVACDPGSSCSVDCSGAGDCSKIRCGAEASCALFCGPGQPCAYAECAGIQQTCSDGTVVCNAHCL